MTFEIRLILIAVIMYLIWAIWHHKKNKSLTMPTFLEYLLTAILAFTLLMGASIQ